jgi:hypothetical protein
MEVSRCAALEKAWHTHGYYGSVSHNVKANGGTFLGDLCFLAGALLLPAGARRNSAPVGPEPGLNCSRGQWRNPLVSRADIDVVGGWPARCSMARR